jgi:hypothetical protein
VEAFKTKAAELSQGVNQWLAAHPLLEGDVRTFELQSELDDLLVRRDKARSEITHYAEMAAWQADIAEALIQVREKQCLPYLSKAFAELKVEIRSDRDFTIEERVSFQKLLSGMENHKIPFRRAIFHAPIEAWDSDKNIPRPLPSGVIAELRKSRPSDAALAWRQLLLSWNSSSLTPKITIGGGKPLTKVVDEEKEALKARIAVLEKALLDIQAHMGVSNPPMVPPKKEPQPKNANPPPFQLITEGAKKLQEAEAKSSKEENPFGLLADLDDGGIDNDAVDQLIDALEGGHISPIDAAVMLANPDIVTKPPGPPPKAEGTGAKKQVVKDVVPPKKEGKQAPERVASVPIKQRPANVPRSEGIPEEKIAALRTVLNIDATPLPQEEWASMDKKARAAARKARSLPHWVSDGYHALGDQFLEDLAAHRVDSKGYNTYKAQRSSRFVTESSKAGARYAELQRDWSALKKEFKGVPLVSNPTDGRAAKFKKEYLKLKDKVKEFLKTAPGDTMRQFLPPLGRLGKGKNPGNSYNAVPPPKGGGKQKQEVSPVKSPGPKPGPSLAGDPISGFFSQLKDFATVLAAFHGALK